MKLYEALAKAQKEFPKIPRNRTAKVRMKSGGEYSYNYADLGDVVNAVLPILHSNGLLYYQFGEVSAGRNKLVTCIAHQETSDKLQSEFLLPDSNDPQATGADITYFRRYALCAALGIVTEDDTDAQGGKQKAGAQKPGQGTTPPSGQGGNAPYLISEPQRKRLRAIQNKSGMPDDILKELITKHGFASSKDITRDKYEVICSEVEKF